MYIKITLNEFTMSSEAPRDFFYLELLKPNSSRVVIAVIFLKAPPIKINLCLGLVKDLLESAKLFVVGKSKAEDVT